MILENVAIGTRSSALIFVCLSRSRLFPLPAINFIKHLSLYKFHKTLDHTQMITSIANGDPPRSLHPWSSSTGSDSLKIVEDSSHVSSKTKKASQRRAAYLAGPRGQQNEFEEVDMLLTHVVNSYKTKTEDGILAKRESERLRAPLRPSGLWLRRGRRGSARLPPLVRIPSSTARLGARRSASV